MAKTKKKVKVPTKMGQRRQMDKFLEQEMDKPKPKKKKGKK